MLGGLGVAAYFLMRKANAAGNLVFVPGTVTSVTADGINPVLTCTIIAQNTSNTDLLLNSFAGNLFANGTLVGNVSNFSGVVIPANAQVAIPLELALLPLGLVNDLILAFRNNTAVQALELDAQANVNSFQVAVKLNYTIGA